MKSLMAYLPGEHHSSWFPSFSRAFCREFLEGEYHVHYAQSRGNCRSTANPLYLTTAGDEITLHQYALALEDLATGDMVLFTSHYRPMDMFRSYGFDLSRLKRLHSAHYNRHLAVEVKGLTDSERFKAHSADDVLAKISPWMFRPETWNGLDAFEGSYSPTNTIRKAYFRGVSNRARECLKFLSGRPAFDLAVGTFQQTNKIDEASYYRELLRYRMALSVPGAGDMCHRDIECFALGIPILRPRFTCTLSHRIPDECYVPVDFLPSDKFLEDPEAYKPWHPQDPERLAGDLAERLAEVIHDEAYLNAVSENAHMHYLRHYKWPRPGAIALEAVRQCFS